MTSVPAFVGRLAHFGDRPALVTSDETISYRRLAELVGGMATELGQQRRLVLVRAATTVDSVVAYLAALAGGHPVVLSAPHADHGSHRGGDISHQDSGDDALVAGYDPDVVVDGKALTWRHRRPRHQLHPDLALLLSTSGSTGSAKLVRLSAANVEANVASIATYLGIGGDDRAITTLPLHYCYGLSVLNSHLARGASVVLTSLSVVDRCFWRLFRSTGATSLAGVPHTFALLDRAGFDAMDLPSLHTVTQAGGRLDPATVTRYAELGARNGWQLFVMYGQTEATARMAYLPPALATDHPDAIGVPVPGGSFRLAPVDDAMSEGVGELVYSGPNVMLGYAESPNDLALGATLDELRTGDLACRDASGLYRIVGRRSRFVKLFGLRVDLDEIERFLAGHGATAVVTGDDERILVGVESGTSTGDVAALVSAHVGLPCTRVRVSTMSALPRLPNGKPDYAALRAPAHAPPPTPTGDRHTTEESLAAIYESVLGRRPADHESFVDLGGDSLSYVEVSIQLENVLGDLPANWHVRAVSDLAAAGAVNAVGAAADGAARRRRPAMETSVVLRAIAMVLIVGTHAKLWYVPGGAHTLLAVAGFNLARFQLRGGDLGRTIARVAVPAMAWIGVVAAVSEQFTLQHALLVNGLIGPKNADWGYWYVESLVLILLVVGAAMSVPAVRRWERRWPFGLAMAVAGVGLLVRFDALGLPESHHMIGRAHEVLWLFALGWAAARASSVAARLMVTVALVAAVPGFFETSGRGTVVAGGILLLLWLRTVPVPRVLQRGVGTIAAASFAVYLTHFQVYPVVGRAFGPGVATIAALAVGVAAWEAGRRARPAWRALRRTPVVASNWRQPASSSATGFDLVA